MSMITQLGQVAGRGARRLTRQGAAAQAPLAGGAMAKEVASLGRHAVPDARLARRGVLRALAEAYPKRDGYAVRSLSTGRVHRAADGEWRQHFSATVAHARIERPWKASGDYWPQRREVMWEGGSYGLWNLFKGLLGA